MIEYNSKTHGKHTILFDESDRELVEQHSWRIFKKIGGNVYYAVTTVTNPNGVRSILFMHRLLLNPPKGSPIDHIDGNGLNNSRANIRVCTSAQNSFNRGKNKTSKKKFKGVYFHVKRRKYSARLGFNGSEIFLGYFTTEEEAALAYNKAALTYFGEFVRLNVINNDDLL